MKDVSITLIARGAGAGSVYAVDTKGMLTPPPMAAGSVDSRDPGTVIITGILEHLERVGPTLNEGDSITLRYALELPITAASEAEEGLRSRLRHRCAGLRMRGVDVSMEMIKETDVDPILLLKLTQQMELKALLRM